jgi:hypothetical protein
MAGIKLLTITNITIFVFIIYLSYTANTFYSMFRPPICKSNNCITPNFKITSNKKLKVKSNRI